MIVKIRCLPGRRGGKKKRASSDGQAPRPDEKHLYRKMAYYKVGGPGVDSHGSKDQAAQVGIWVFELDSQATPLGGMDEGWYIFFFYMMGDGRWIGEREEGAVRLSG